MRVIRSVWLAVIIGVLVAACGGEDPIQVAAEGICAAIDNEPSDEVAFDVFEREVARERRDGMDEDALLGALDATCGRTILAISAATVTDDEELEEPEPEAIPEAIEEPEIVFADLRRVTWTDQTWMTDCTEEGVMRGVTLTSEDGIAGLHRPPEPAMTPVYVVELQDAVFGDVTGDGREDAVFVTQCVYASAEFFVEVWSHNEDGQPHHLPLVHHYSKFEAAVDRVEAAAGLLRVHSIEGAPGDDMPHLNGYPVEVVTDWTFDGTAWIPTEVSRTDTTPPPPPPPPKPAPPTESEFDEDEEVGHDYSDVIEDCKHLEEGTEAYDQCFSDAWWAGFED